MKTLLAKLWKALHLPKNLQLLTMRFIQDQFLVGITGIIFNDQGLSKAVFRQAGQGFVFFKPSELPLYEDAFAMTIHKSQGAEFDSVLLILPPASSFITRQLLYTGLTRAKKQVIIVGNRETILEASNQTIVRHSNIPNLINQQLDQKRYS